MAARKAHNLEVVGSSPTSATKGLTFSINSYFFRQKYLGSSRGISVICDNTEVVTLNEKNLVPNSRRTPSERRELASKAGKASGEARRRKKSMREKMMLLLSMPAADNDVEELEALGIAPEDMDNEMVIVKALFLRAADGDVKAIHEIRNLLGIDDAAEELKLRRKDSKRKDKELELKEKTFENNNW